MTEAVLRHKDARGPAGRSRARPAGGYLQRGQQPDATTCVAAAAVVAAATMSTGTSASTFDFIFGPFESADDSAPPGYGLQCT